MRQRTAREQRLFWLVGQHPRFQKKKKREREKEKETNPNVAPEVRRVAEWGGSETHVESSAMKLASFCITGFLHPPAISTMR